MVETSGNFLQRLSTTSKQALENFFFRWGFTVATHPWKFITICVLLTTLFGSGLVYFKEETRPDKLILPSSAEYVINTEWIRSQVAIPIRENFAAITADNVLSQEVMRVLIGLHETVKSVSTKNGKTWEDVCFRVPVTKFDFGDESLRRRRRKVDGDDRNATVTTSSESGNSVFADDFFKDESEEGVYTKSKQWFAYHKMPESLYCSIVNSLEEMCLEFNPVELWSYDKRTIYNLTQEEVIRVFNHEIISPVSGRKTNYKMELGGKMERNEKGEIIKAESLLMTWDVKIDLTQEIITDSHGLVGDADGLEWEKAWIKAMKKFANELPNKKIKLYFANASCWGDILDETFIKEGMILGLSFVIMFIFVHIMIGGSLNRVGQRPFLTCSGLTSIAFSLIISCGICSLLSLRFTLLNRVLPFLILGIGIDDMFVIMQCWKNLQAATSKNKQKMLPIPERVAITLKHAGVSITITSVTDVCAFMAGSLTTIPTLRSFCIYAAIGISVLFIFQCTLFIASLAIDQKRLEERRNAYFFWIKYNEDEFVTRNTDAGTSYLQIFFDKILAKYLLTKTSKVIVLFSTGGLLAAGIYGNIHLKQHSDALWFIPEDSYLVQYAHMLNRNYPEFGFPGIIVAHEMNWTESLSVFGSLVEELQESPHLHGIQQFYTSFKTFVMEVYDPDLTLQQLDQKKLHKYLGKFLFSPYGARYKYFFKLNGTFSCGDSLPEIQTVIVPFNFKLFDSGPDDDEHVAAMHKIKALVRNASDKVTFKRNSNNEGRLFFWAQISVAWEVDEIIKEEMYKNLVLSMSCVMLAVLFLLADLKMCLMCGICIIFTVIQTCGFMHYWGLTIDSVACTILVLAVGLCVDYAAHICLAFMESRKASKTLRAQEALSNIGPAVFCGGFSTFLGVILLINGTTVAGLSFFKIFTLVVLFGLFHGLIFLPVLLSLFGSELLPDRKPEEQCSKLLEMTSMTNANANFKGHKEDVEFP